MTSDDPGLIPRDALAGVTVGLSVSDSADLARLGLTARHAHLVVGELTRSILIAGGTVLYGGRLRPSGFTQQLMNEVRRFGTTRHSITLCLALPEHRSMGRDDLDRIDRELGMWGRLITLDGSGDSMDWRQAEPTEEPLPDEARTTSYSEQRRWMADQSQGRVLVGGQLRGFQGAQPGLIEEAAMGVERGQPLYLAGGLGGATAAVSRRLDPGSLDWLPHDLPAGEDDPPVQAALDQLRQIADERAWTISEDGLSEAQRRLFAASHRPGEIASLAVVGLAARFSTDGQGPG